MILEAYYHEYIPTKEEIKTFIKLPKKIVVAYERYLQEIAKILPKNSEPLEKIYKYLLKNPRKYETLVPAFLLMQNFYTLRKKKYDLAYRAYFHILKIKDPNNPFDYVKRSKNGFAASIVGLKLLKFNVDSEMASEAKKYLKELRNFFYSARVNYGILFALESNYESAINEFKEAVKMRDDVGLAYYNLGILLKKYGQIKEAIYYLEKAYTVNFPYPAAKVVLNMWKHNDKDENLYMKVA